MNPVRYVTKDGVIAWYIHCKTCRRFWTGLPEDRAAHIAEHHRKQHQEQP